MKTAYYTVDGEVLASESSGARTDLLPDALGSVVSVADSSGAVVGTRRYKPYGSDLSSSGPGTNPKYGWVGRQGYRESGFAQSEHYVRARHYSDGPGRWRSVDPLWPEESGYGYALSNPVMRSDPSGMKVDLQAGCAASVETQFKDLCSKLNRLLVRGGPDLQALIENCIGSVSGAGSRNIVKKILETLRDQCNDKKGSKPRVCVFCSPSAVPGCESICSGGGRLGITPSPLTGPGNVYPPGASLKDDRCRGERRDIPRALPIPDYPYKDCSDALSGRAGGCGAVIILCGGGGGQTLMHELVHAIGIGGQTGHGGGGGVGDLTERIESCLAKLP